MFILFYFAYCDYNTKNKKFRNLSRLLACWFCLRDKTVHTVGTCERFHLHTLLITAYENNII